MTAAPTPIMRFIIIVLLSAIFAVTSCANKAQTGTAIGAGAGGAIGGLAFGTTGLVVGAITGGALGYIAGKHMDNEDRRRAAEALERNRAASWHNEDGDSYRMVPTKTTHRDGRTCRNFRMYAEVDGKPDEVHGTACRRSDGQWETIST